jgi:hypothetical protein
MRVDALFAAVELKVPEPHMGLSATSLFGKTKTSDKQIHRLHISAGSAKLKIYA